MTSNPYLFLLTILSSMMLSSCNSDNNAVLTTTPVADSIRLQEPFRFHKQIEVKPGLTFDVLSWGRGSETNGSFLILRSDSLKLQYKSTSAELEGKILDAWNMDMDADGNPEIFIQAKGQGEGSYLNMYIYEFNDGGSAQQIRFPVLTGSVKKSYRGLDSLYVSDGKLRRIFPLFNETDTTGKPSIGKKMLEYSLRNNSLSVKELEDKPQN